MSNFDASKDMINQSNAQISSEESKCKSVCNPQSSDNNKEILDEPSN